MDYFGISHDIEPRIIARDLELPIEAGDIVLFTGGSGSGKSSLLRAVALQLEQSSLATDSFITLSQLDLGKQSLVDSLPVEFDEALQLLSMCGLGEAPLMLRTPAELSDGQRYRFAFALAIARRPNWIIADEFAALLDRTTAQVIAHNVRRLADRYGFGCLLATAQDDLAADLEADIHLTCELDGTMNVQVRRCEPVLLPHPATTPGRRSKKKRAAISFRQELWLSRATRCDWPYFARWHYRSHHIGLMKFGVLLWHQHQPIGICLFVAPPRSLRPRNQFFGHRGSWNRASMLALNHQLVTLQRVVIHPAYRGAGLASAFVRRACELCPFPWIETMSQMGQVHPFFESAGFHRVGVITVQNESRETHSRIFGGRRRGTQALVTEETFLKSRYASPVYYIFDNRRNVTSPREAQTHPEVDPPRDPA